VALFCCSCTAAKLRLKAYVFLDSTPMLLSTIGKCLQRSTLFLSLSKDTVVESALTVPGAVDTTSDSSPAEVLRSEYERYMADIRLHVRSIRVQSLHQFDVAVDHVTLASASDKVLGLLNITMLSEDLRWTVEQSKELDAPPTFVLS
jgi:hypothetical protein